MSILNITSKSPYSPVLFPIPIPPHIRNMLDLKTALDIFDSGKWVSLAFVCADKQKGTYGRIVRIPKCRKLTRLQHHKNAAATSAYTGISRNPNHDDHFTRNALLPNGSKRKFHFRLLFAINGEKLV